MPQVRGYWPASPITHACTKAVMKHLNYTNFRHGKNERAAKGWHFSFLTNFHVLIPCICAYSKFSILRKEKKRGEHRKSQWTLSIVSVINKCSTVVPGWEPFELITIKIIKKSIKISQVLMCLMNQLYHSS